MVAAGERESRVHRALAALPPEQAAQAVSTVLLGTLLAAILVGRLPAAALGDGHAHHHH